MSDGMTPDEYARDEGYVDHASLLAAKSLVTLPAEELDALSEELMQVVECLEVMDNYGASLVNRADLLRRQMQKVAVVAGKLKGAAH